jgi:hypothetical protein
MKKVLLGIAGALVVTIGGVAAAASMQPETTHVERSVTVAASAADLEPHVSDFTNFVNWSPWTGLDPDQTTTFSDPSGGQGAWYTWEGNDDVGKGRMDLTLQEPGKVTHHLTFLEPFAAEADANILWTQQGDGLEVTWTYDADNDFMGKVMSLFMDMDDMLGPDYEKGLASLKSNVEKDAETRIAKEKQAAEQAATEAAAKAAEGEAAEGEAAGG